jgi:hypothetical protein
LATSFNDQFDQHGAWRREFALRLKLLAEWLKDHELLDSAVEERLRRLEGQMRSDKVMVAFVRRNWDTTPKSRPACACCPSKPACSRSP